MPTLNSLRNRRILLVCKGASFIEAEELNKKYNSTFTQLNTMLLRTLS
ncbi:hypothetical protein [Methylomonas albis]|nr:hypothetical protein [Methylomonas albis]